MFSTTLIPEALVKKGGGDGKLIGYLTTRQPPAAISNQTFQAGLRAYEQDYY